MSVYADRPFFTFRFGRDWLRQEGWTIAMIIAPYPADEQEQGAYCRALINARLDIRPRWPFLRWDAYTPRRDRLGEQP